MNTRGAKLVSPAAFEASLRHCAADIASFENDHLESEALKAAATAERLWSLIEKLRISASGVRLVACTKALHHLLPNLVVPMDRQFTGAFFGWNTHDWQKKEERIQVCVRCVPRDRAKSQARSVHRGGLEHRPCQNHRQRHRGLLPRDPARSSQPGQGGDCSCQRARHLRSDSGPGQEAPSALSQLVDKKRTAHIAYQNQREVTTPLSAAESKELIRLCETGRLYESKRGYPPVNR